MLFLPFRVILSSQLELSLFILSGAGLKKQEMGLEPGSEFNSALSYALCHLPLTTIKIMQKAL